MAPITWRNIGIPNVSLGQAALVGLASKNFDKAGGNLTSILQDSKALQEKNNNQLTENNTNSILDKLTQEQDLDALNHTQVGQFADDYGVMYDREAIQKALTKQRDSARTGAIGSALANADPNNLSVMDRRNSIMASLTQQGVDKNHILDATNNAMKAGTDIWAGIKTKAIQDNTNKFLSENPINSSNYKQKHLQAQKAYGSDINLKMIEEQGNIAVQQDTDALVKAAVSTNDINAGTSGILGSNLNSTVKRTALQQYRNMVAPTADQKQINILNAQIAKITADETFEDNLIETDTQLAEWETKLKQQNMPEYLTLGWSPKQKIDGYSSPERALIGDKNDERTTVYDDVDADDVANAKTEMRKVGLSSAQIKGVFYEIYNNGEVADAGGVFSKDRTAVFNSAWKGITQSVVDWNSLNKPYQKLKAARLKDTKKHENSINKQMATYAAKGLSTPANVSMKSPTFKNTKSLDSNDTLVKAQQEYNTYLSTKKNRILNDQGAAMNYINNINIPKNLPTPKN